MTREVLITIRGSQPESEDMVVTAASGTYHFTNGKHYIQYEEQAEGADFVIKNIMKISSDRIILSKKGVQASQMVFDLHEAEQAIYHTPYGSFHFETNTKYIEISVTKSLIEIKMEYCLSADASKVSDHEIQILIQSSSPA